MNILLTVITPLLVGFGLAFAFASMKKENTRKNAKLNRRNFVIRSSYTWGIIMGTINAVLLPLLIVGLALGELGVGVSIVISLCIILFSIGIVQNVRERVAVKDDDIVYTPIFGKSKGYTFSQIDRVEKRKTGIYVYVENKKVFSLDPAGIGTSLFLELYRQKR